ncbi:MAG: PaaI family thioesterase [Alphaproteobacteria bacterium]|nr:MAG: PaaI family thioesterase [Alphaproteobacteria bacterium]
MREMPPDYAPVANEGYNAYLGSIYKKDAPVGTPTGHFLFDLKPHHLNGGGTAHGGLIMSLLDTSCGATVAQLVGASGSTVSFNCDFLDGVQVGARLEIAARVTQKTKTVAFVEGQLMKDGNVLATARGIWRIFPERASA